MVISGSKIFAISPIKYSREIYIFVIFFFFYKYKYYEKLAIWLADNLSSGKLRSSQLPSRKIISLLIIKVTSNKIDQSVPETRSLSRTALT